MKRCILRPDIGFSNFCLEALQEVFGILPNLKVVKTYIINHIKVSDNIREHSQEALLQSTMESRDEER